MPGRLRIALAGAGEFGREHLKRLAARADVEIAGIADTSDMHANSAAAEFGVARVEHDAREFTASNRPDGLIIATPGPTHVALARAALESGIPVLVEKPVAMNAAEARQLADVAAASSAFVLPGHVLRFSEHHRLLREIAHSDEIGPLLSFMSRRHRDDQHALRYAGVDPVLMTMIHDIDLGLWMTGESATEVFALRRPAGKTRSHTMEVARGSGGVLWHLHAAWTFAGTETPPDRVEIVGERGSVELEAGRAIRQFGARARTIDLATTPEDPLAMELDHFIACIRNGERPKAVTMEDACAGLAFAEAVLASLKTGFMVRL